MADAGIIYGKDVEKIRNDFREILSEIDSIVQGSYREKEGFEKIKELIDVTRIDRLLQVMDAMEKRAKEADERAISAFRDMEKYRRDLEKEQIRLEKLWDAYKMISPGKEKRQRNGRTNTWNRKTLLQT